MLRSPFVLGIVNEVLQSDFNAATNDYEKYCLVLVEYFLVAEIGLFFEKKVEIICIYLYPHIYLRFKTFCQIGWKNENMLVFLREKYGLKRRQSEV